jgi:hypothetical protein
MSLRCVWRLGLRGKASCNERHNRVSIWVRWQGSQVSKSRPGAPFAFANKVGVAEGQVVPLLGTDVSEINWWVPQVSILRPGIPATEPKWTPGYVCRYKKVRIEVCLIG